MEDAFVEHSRIVWHRHSCLCSFQSIEISCGRRLTIGRHIRSVALPRNRSPSSSSLGNREGSFPFELSNQMLTEDCLPKSAPIGAHLR